MKTVIISLFVLQIIAARAWSEPLPVSDQAATSAPSAATISGQILIRDNVPMNNGVVLLYDKKTGAPPHPNNYWRIPDLISSIDDQGRFTVTVVDGTYYLMAAQKNPNDDIGPPKGKELLYFHGDAAGNALPITVPGDGNVDIGVHKASLWAPRVFGRKGITAIEGVVTDLDGGPVEKALVFAYLSKEAVGRPVFVSDRTDKKGKFQLRVSDGGEYYLKVRSVLGGGAPQEGEHLNTIQGFKPVMVALKKGQIRKGVALKVKKFSRSTGAGGNKSPGQWKPDNVQRP